VGEQITPCVTPILEKTSHNDDDAAFCENCSRKDRNKDEFMGTMKDPTGQFHLQSGNI